METFRQILVDRLGGEPLPRGAIARMSRRTGIRDHVISRWLNKDQPRRPSPENLERVAPDLEVPYDQLVGIVYAGAQPEIQPDQPPDYRDRLLKVSEMLLKVAAELSAVATGAPAKAPVALLDGNGEMAGETVHHYVWQKWRPQLVPTGPAPLMFPRMGALFQRCPA